MILDLPLILETRRNHAVEHATLHILADKYKNQNMAGHSNPGGVFPLRKLRQTGYSICRNRSDESSPCGRKRAGCPPGLRDKPGDHRVSAGAVCLAPFRGVRSTPWRIVLIPLALSFAVLGFFLSRPVGTWLQAHVTTEADLGNMRVVDIALVRKGVYKVVTK